jgi:hypothetical protein
MSYLRTFALAAIACAFVGVTGCSGGDGRGGGPPPAITTQIFSDAGVDGDIEQTSSTSFTVTQGMSPSVQSVFAGIVPATLTEFRAFLNFPLSGAGGVPGDALIESAFLDIYINSLQPLTGSIPILIELVSFQPPTLLETDFDRTIQPPLASLSIDGPFTAADVGTNVSLDVTSLMVHAQQLGLADFQLRIMQDLGPAIPVLMEINDSTGADRSTNGPLLTVTYF